MFHDPTLGLVLALSHYISNLLIGIILGLSSTRTKLYNITRQNVFKNSLRVFLDEQRQRNPLGKILGDSIRTGINNITLVGGFIVFFAVLTNILSISGILNYMFGFFIFLLKIVGIDPAINTSLSKGFWEITLGLKDLSRLPLSFTVKAVTASIILGWSGLSIQTQVISFLSGSGIRPRLYYSCRVLQALLAGLISLVLSLTSHLWSNLSVLPVFSSLVISDSTVYGIKDRFFYNLSLTFHGFLLIFTVMIIISLLITQIGKIKNKPQLW
jgi:sporulation integral membrane protein YlbJ